MTRESLKDKLRNKIDMLEQEHLEKNYYSIEHPRTKEAEDFVKDLQAKKRDFQRELQYQQTIQLEAQARKKQ